MYIWIFIFILLGVAIYLELLRYIYIHIRSMNSCVNSYRQLPRGDPNKVVVSLTTTPERINSLKPVFKSLLNQSVRVDQIALNLPYKCKGESYNIPSWIYKVANIFKVGKDYGPGTKILPTLLREGERDTKIIYVDDDRIYGYYFIETLLTTSRKNPRSAIYTRGKMDAAGGVLVKPSFFDADIINRKIEYYTDNWIYRVIKVPRIKVSFFSNYRCLI
jgi:hypothetical protein